MTGRDLIIYIMSNELEDEPVYSNGKFLGFLTSKEAASKFEVGEATIHTWFKLGLLDGIIISDILLVAVNEKKPIIEKGTINV